jgi:hypothetical protein
VRLSSIVLLLLLLTRCSTEPPVGDPIDLDRLRYFEPFTLKTIGGETKTLEDFLAQLTLVSFFFPT